MKPNPKCPDCGAEIEALNHHESGSKHYVFFYDNYNDECDYDSRDFVSDGEVNEYTCPVCAKCLFTTETDAMKFLSQIKFNDNITLIHRYRGKPLEKYQLELKENEYFVLMVKDNPRGEEDKRKFFRRDKGWIGLEKTHGKIYISKQHSKRYNTATGHTFIATVKDKTKCVVL